MLISIAVCLFVASAVYALPYMFGACFVAPAPKDMLFDNPTVGDCVEFWLWRYQTIVSAFVALGAAVYAGSWVREQIRASDRQLAASRQQIAAAAADRLLHRSGQIADLAGLLNSIASGYSGIKRDLLSMHSWLTGAEEPGFEAPEYREAIRAQIEERARWLQKNYQRSEEILRRTLIRADVKKIVRDKINEYDQPVWQACEGARFVIESFDLLSRGERTSATATAEAAWMLVGGLVEPPAFPREESKRLMQESYRLDVLSDQAVRQIEDAIDRGAEA
jgi:hypothetical protein